MRISSLFACFAALCLLPFARGQAAGAASFELRDGLIWIDAQIPAYGPAKFLVDSGAGATLIDHRLAKALGLRNGRPHSIRGVHGTAAAHWVSGIDGTVAGAPLPEAALSVDLQLIASPGERIDGLLGADFFARRAVQIDFARKVLRVLAPGESARLSGESVALTRRNDCFSALVSVDGGEPKWMRIDTGCDSALEWVAPADTQGATRGRKRAEVKLGGLVMPNVEVGVHATPFFRGEHGLIGNGLLARYSVTLDVPRKQLILAQR